MTWTTAGFWKNWLVYHEEQARRKSPDEGVVVMQVLYENIPAYLLRFDRQVAWQYEERDGKMTKPSYVPAAGKKRHALVNVRSTWGTYEQFGRKAHHSTVRISGYDTFSSCSRWLNALVWSI